MELPIFDTIDRLSDYGNRFMNIAHVVVRMKNDQSPCPFSKSGVNCIIREKSLCFIAIRIQPWGYQYQLADFNFRMSAQVFYPKAAATAMTDEYRLFVDFIPFDFAAPCVPVRIVTMRYFRCYGSYVLDEQPFL